MQTQAYRYVTRTIKLIPKKKQKQSLRRFFEDASKIWKFIIDNSITDTKEVKGMGTDVLAAQFVQGMVREFQYLLKSQKELKKLGKSGKIKYRDRYTVTHFSGQPVKKITDTRIVIAKLGSFYARGLK